jgi:hypothetical protein
VSTEAERIAQSHKLKELKEQAETEGVSGSGTKLDIAQRLIVARARRGAFPDEEHPYTDPAPTPKVTLPRVYLYHMDRGSEVLVFKDSLRRAGYRIEDQSEEYGDELVALVASIQRELHPNELKEFYTGIVDDEIWSHVETLINDKLT